MIDTISLLLAHILMGFMAIRIMLSDDINVEPIQSGRQFKTVGPRA